MMQMNYNVNVTEISNHMPNNFAIWDFVQWIKQVSFTCTEWSISFFF